LDKPLAFEKKQVTGYEEGSPSLLGLTQNGEIVLRLIYDNPKVVRLICRWLKWKPFSKQKRSS